MDKKTIQKLKKKILLEKKNLERELKEIATRDKVLKNDYDAKFCETGKDVGESAFEVQNLDLNLSLEANLEVALALCNKALEKIKKGTYGLCDKCGKKINLRRLVAFPQVRFCLECQKKLGKGTREMRKKWSR